MAAVKVSLKQLRQGVNLKANQAATLTVSVGVPMLEVADAHFHTDSAVLLPDDDPSDPNLGANARRTGLSVLASALLFAQRNPGKRLLVTGHTDTQGSEEHNLELSADRSDGVYFLLTGDKDAWVELCGRRSKVEDYQQILHWIAVTWSWPCDPGAVDGEDGSSTKDAVRKYQMLVCKLLGGTLTEDGEVGPEVWGSFFDIYLAALARLAGTSDLDGMRAAITFTDPARVGCGENFPRDNPGQDNLASAVNRRVELYFFDADEAPKLACHASAGACDKSACDVFNHVFAPDPLPSDGVDLGVLAGLLPLPDPMLGPLRSLHFAFDDRALEAAKPDGTPIAQGEQGTAVGRAQNALRQVGIPLSQSSENGAPDSDFGDETVEAVRQFQTSFPNLPGVEVGDETQRYLKAQPLPLEPDGTLNRKTLYALDALMLDKSASQAKSSPAPDSSPAAAPDSAKAASSAALVPGAAPAPNRCGLVRGSPKFAADLEACFMSQLAALRPGLNRNNLTRTAFYSQYAARHPEIPWALLASLVSRNAGYNFSDIGRYEVWASMLEASTPLLPVVGVTFEEALSFIERFLEAGNFLIFNDVFPQLLAYELAKEAFLDTGDPDCNTLFLSLTRLAGVEAEVSLEWFNFFGTAVSEHFFIGNPSPSTDPRIIRHSVGLIANEQNYLEHMLMNPVAGAPLYMNQPLMPIGKTAVSILTDVVFPVMGRFHLTRLVFNTSLAGSASTSNEVFQHIVGNFANVDDRIDTGRALFFGVFLASGTRRDGIDRFQAAVPHTASRTDYDTSHFTTSLRLLPLFAPYFSPKLNTSNFPLAGWPGPPPVSLPAWGASDPARVARFRSVVAAPLTTDAFAPPLGDSAAAGAARKPVEVFL